MLSNHDVFSRVRHIVLAVLCLIYFISYIDRVNISVAAPLIRSELALTPTELGLIFSAFAYPYAAMQIAGGWLSDRLGARLVLTALGVLWSAATVLTGLSWSVTSLAVFRVLVGLGEGGAFPTATRALTFWMPAGERGFAQGITHSFARLGGAVTPPLVLAIVARSGWRASFTILGLASVLCTAAWIVTFRDSPADHPWMTTRELDELPRNGPGNGVDQKGKAARLHVTPWREILTRMWLVTFVDFCYGWSLWVFLTWLPTYLSEARGFKLNDMATMAMLPLMAGVIGDTLGGVASDALLKRTGHLRLARVSVLLVGLLGALAFIVPAALTGRPSAAVFFLALAFFFLELTNAVLWTLPIDIAGSYAGTAGGMMNSGFGLAGMISPVMFGVIIERTGRYDVPFLLSGGLLLVGALAALFIDPTRRVRPDAE